MRGGGTSGCLLSIVLILIFAYTSYQLVPIYYHASEFKDEVDGLVRRLSVRQANEAKILPGIMDFAGRREIPLTKENVRIVRLTDRIRVEVQYDREFRTPIYSRMIHKQFTVESFMGTL